MKYQGPDGWLHDDSVGPHLNRSKEPLEKCPNCGSKAGWRRMEQRCAHCHWEGKKKSPGSEMPDGCCVIMALLIILPLIGTGIGYGVGGFGGLLTGLGISLAILLLPLLISLMDRSDKKREPDDPAT